MARSLPNGRSGSFRSRKHRLVARRDGETTHRLFTRRSAKIPVYQEIILDKGARIEERLKGARVVWASGDEDLLEGENGPVARATSTANQYSFRGADAGRV